MLCFLAKTKYRITPVASVVLSLSLIPGVTSAAPNNAPSFTPGHEPTSSACNPVFEFPGWAQNVTDGDGGTSGLSFHITDLTNSDIYSRLPHVSWPSRTLRYELKPDVPGGMISTVTAVLKDSSGTDQGGQDTSEPQTWNIYTESCGKESEVLLDQDGDGISDIDEGGGVLDTDGDGMADSIDPDSDNDGIADIDENEDSDNDGIRDSEEANGDNVSTDTDGDGVNDEFDLDDDNDGIVDSLEGFGLLDTDNDNLPDSLDLDSDNDGLSDLLESGVDLTQLTFSDGVLTSPAGENGLTDLLETTIDSGIPKLNPFDSDRDGTADFQDADQGQFSIDTDRDGVADDVDIDDDNDGILDTIEGSGLIDSDNDNLPDSQDLDSDNDGLTDLLESGGEPDLLIFSEEGMILNETGQNGFADPLETTIDSGIPVFILSDVNTDGTPDFQQPDEGLVSTDSITDFFNDPETGRSLLRTGLQGSGCTLGGQAAVDPLLFLTALFAFIYVWRRRILSFFNRRIMSY